MQKEYGTESESDIQKDKLTLTGELRDLKMKIELNSIHIEEVNSSFLIKSLDGSLFLKTR